MENLKLKLTQKQEALKAELLKYNTLQRLSRKRYFYSLKRQVQIYRNLSKPERMYHYYSRLF